MTKLKNRKTVILRCIALEGRRCFVAADEFSAASLGKKFHVGAQVSAELRMARNPGFHRLVHQFGSMVVENIEDYSGCVRANGKPDSHRALKRMQWEGDIGCDHIACNVPGIGPSVVRIPQSLAYEEMEEDEFQAIYTQFCEYVRKRYWPSLQPGQIEQMAEFLREAA